MYRIRRAASGRYTANRIKRSAQPFTKRQILQAARALWPMLATLAFSGVAHAQGTMDFSGATTLMSTFKTSPETIEKAMAFYSSIGKKPIRLFKALPGHVANRLQAALYKEVLYLIQQGVLSVADADVAVSYGPGPRWGVMGPSLQWHLGGGAGGIKHFMEHIMGPMETWMKALGTPDITPELKQTVADAVIKIAGNRSVEQLAAEENEVVTGLLSSRAKAGL
ncbi:MAG TPA: 3-hydroxyacyl-CoA dehydrogenase family protein [Edaphobacter sp.]|nr:3-hydroxyacyl-CoA dehydrogenase family protein [Edaphobacter sp.]